MSLLTQRNTGQFRFNSLTDLRALSGENLKAGEIVFLSSATPTADGSERMYAWNASSTDTDDGEATIKLTDTDTGRLKLYGAFLQSGTGATPRSMLAKARDASLSPEDFGAVGDGATNDYAAMQAAIARAQSLGGATIEFGAGKTYATETGLVIDADNVRLLGKGDGSQILYTGDQGAEYLLYVKSPADEGVAISNLKLQGGSYQAGKVKYVLKADFWGRGCVLRDAVIREGLGLMRINAAYYGVISNVQCVQSVPNPEAQGWSLADWQDVYSVNNAPIYIGGGGGGTKIDRLTALKVGSELHGATRGAQLVYFGTNCQVDALTLESSGIAYEGHDTETDNAIVAKDCSVAFSQLYMEAVGFVVSAVYATGTRANISLREPFVYDMRGGAVGALLFNDATHDMICEGGEFYRIDCKRFDRAATTSGGVGGGFLYRNNIVATGERTTDAAYNAFADNVYDTLDQANPLGLESAVARSTPRDTQFPEKIAGLTVTASSDGDGHYVQVTAGVLLNDRNGIASCKVAAAGSPSTMVAYRLRPQTASRYCRLHMGFAGNLYLEESASAFTDDRGNWLAQFETNGSVEIGSLVQNPRTTMIGRYSDGVAIVRRDATPASGNWKVGDRIEYATPTAGGFLGEVCTTAGSPGTWKTYGVVSA